MRCYFSSICKPSRWKQLFQLLAVISVTGCYQSASIGTNDSDPFVDQASDDQTAIDDTVGGTTGTDIDSVFPCGTENTFGLWQWQRDVIEEKNIEETSEITGSTNYIRFSPLPDDDYLAGSYAIIDGNNETQYDGYFAFTTGQWRQKTVPILLMWEENNTTNSSETPSTSSYTSQAVVIDMPDCDTLVFFSSAENSDGKEVVIQSEYIRVE
jgi:hypothetical protein